MGALAIQSDNEYYRSEHLPDAVNPEASLKVMDTQLEQWLQERENIAGQIHTLADSAKGNAVALRYFYTNTSDLSFGKSAPQSPSALLSDPQKAVRALDAQMWVTLLATGKLVAAMSSKKRKEWEALIQSGEAPAFTREHVIPTVQALLSEQGLYFAERVDTIFHALSPNHITNSPAGFGKRLILAKLFKRDRGAYESYTTNSENIDPLDDLRVVIATLMGRATLDTARALTATTISQLLKRGCFGEWIPLDGNSLRIKLFKVGTVHVELHPELASKLNDILAMIYPAAIPESFRRAKSAHKSMPDFEMPVESQVVSLSVISALMNYRRLELNRNWELHDLLEQYEGFDVLYTFNDDDVTDKEGLHKTLKAIGGTHVDKWYWSFDYNPSLAIQLICETGTLPNEKNFQYYPSAGDIGEQAANILRAHIETAGAQILEPSVGQGHLALRVPEATWTCIEASPTNAAVAKAKGLDVTVGDFITWAQDTTARFDGVLMNPPFNNSQALHHVNTAHSLLAPGGVLVAIVPDGEQFLKLQEAHPEMEATDSINKAFTGVSVTVRIVTIKAEG